MPESDSVATSYQYLASFLGPKAENRDVLEELLLTVLRDYVHWRANYHPSDDPLLSPSLERSLQHATDNLTEHVYHMMAQLRRNFPFYSPRYLAHMLSDVTMPSLIGAFAGTLFNPNNVTTEAAPVTVEWELDACNQIMQMLGFISPPAPSKGQYHDDYLESLPQSFGWSHLTFDGTTATIESLWVARTVKYLPLAIKDASHVNDINFAVYLPNGQPKLLSELDEYQLLLLQPSSCMKMLQAYIQAYAAQHRGRHSGVAATPSTEAWKSLRASSQDIVTKGAHAIFARHKPVIFATGAAHYCLSKAADLLGMGADSIIQVEMTDGFRMSPESLRFHLGEAIRNKHVPLAVVGICATTEEGSVDPVHLIVKERTALERNHNASFWLHVDAAWGGYIRSLFNATDDDLAEEALLKIAAELKLDIGKGVPEWPMLALEALGKHLDGHKRKQLYTKCKPHIKEVMRHLTERRSIGLSVLVGRLAKVLHESGLLKSSSVFDFTSTETVDLVSSFMTSVATVHWKGESHKLDLRWNQRHVLEAFLSMREADSIVCDPHKMGYCVYPAGLIAFRDNRVRQCIRQKAPYITALGERDFSNFPPRYVEKVEAAPPGVEPRPGRLVVEALAPFILEGSRPGASAASLWLSTRAIPPTRNHHGQIIRASLLAANMLYQMLAKSSEVLKRQSQHPFRFEHTTGGPPDTNVVTFVVVPSNYTSLGDLNYMTDRVYQQFSIRTELGERHYSYSQPFFLSHHKFSDPQYPYISVRKFLERCDIQCTEKEYCASGGIEVLRAAVMNPYLLPLQQRESQGLVVEFLEALCEASGAAFRSLVARSAPAQQ